MAAVGQPWLNAVGWVWDATSSLKRATCAAAIHLLCAVDWSAISLTPTQHLRNLADGQPCWCIGLINLIAHPITSSCHLVCMSKPQHRCFGLHVGFGNGYASVRLKVNEGYVRRVRGARQEQNQRPQPPTLDQGCELQLAVFAPSSAHKLPPRSSMEISGSHWPARLL